MLTQFQEYLTFENIYIYSNYGVLPFWILLIAAPRSKITQILVNSIILPLILSTAYVYIFYQAILLDERIFEIFKLYFSIDNLYTIFATESFLLIFWIHFLALSLFLGSWVSRDAVKYNIQKKIVMFPLILIYFTGPLGFILYWSIRIFYSKKIGLHD
tara:strand:- start:680 stop:1153 length:474 start_codon:yes stop_codon:yes gene_type:complete